MDNIIIDHDLCFQKFTTYRRRVLTNLNHEVEVLPSPQHVIAQSNVARRIVHDEVTALWGNCTTGRVTVGVLYRGTVRQGELAVGRERVYR